METLFNQDDLDNLCLNASELFLLLSMYHEANVKTTYESLIRKNCFKLEDDGILFNSSKASKIEALLEKYQFENTDVQSTVTIDIPDLAVKLRNLFPEGKKPGTMLYWRGNKPEIIKKLESFFNKYGFYEPEAIIKATEKYLQSYERDMRFMQLLKYFISKKKNVGGEIEEMSELMTYLENINTPDQESTDDWTITTVN